MHIFLRPLIGPQITPWIVPAWSPKNKDLFRIGLVDCPRVRDVRLVDRPRVEPYKKE